MQVKKVINILGAINDTGRLASDMYDLDKKEYFSRGSYITIADMDFQHMVRAFVKQNAENNDKTTTRDYTFEELRKELKDSDNIIRKLREDLQNGFKQSVDDLDSLKAQEKIIAGLRSQVETLSAKVKDQDRGRVLRIKELNEQLEEKDQEYMNYTAMLERQRDMYKNIAKESTRLNGHYYTFSEVPQDEEGKEFIKNCKKYLNKESYAIRVKGQHLKKELYGQGRAYHGANMEDSTHMRVYIDKKRGDE